MSSFFKLQPSLFSCKMRSCRVDNKQSQPVLHRQVGLSRGGSISPCCCQLKIDNWHCELWSLIVWTHCQTDSAGIWKWGCMRYLCIVSVLPPVNGGQHTLSLEKQTEIRATTKNNQCSGSGVQYIMNIFTTLPCCETALSVAICKNSSSVYYGW